MFNHTKDIPFAAAMMAATYPLLRIGRELPQPRWRHSASIEITRELLEGRMYPLTLAGLDEAIDALT